MKTKTKKKHEPDIATLHDVIRKVTIEMAFAIKRYGDPKSTHESLGVLIEEVDELRLAVRSNVLPAISRESVQVAAVALRLAEMCDRDEAAFRERSGG